MPNPMANVVLLWCLAGTISLIGLGILIWGRPSLPFEVRRLVALILCLTPLVMALSYHLWNWGMRIESEGWLLAWTFLAPLMAMVVFVGLVQKLCSLSRKKTPNCS